ncbi:AraC family transcriptional regulator [Flammeovirga sp. SubArs3]|uniref:helix-turn-helix domain-containing protein n=1 Tax=Flammeovirga sp. SubArs3 TaxID=2995316 RepID=UPI00248C12FC|nr:AraC family transcriptional regulator [Flammeovirga sp. SubArs3]
MRIFYIQESKRKENYQKFAEEFGGTFDGENLKIDNDDLKVDITYFENIFGVSVIINEVYLEDDVRFEINPTKEEQLMLYTRFMTSSDSQVIINDKTVEQEYIDSAVISNNKNSLETIYRKGKKIKSVTIVVPFSEWIKVTKNDYPELTDFFQEETPWIEVVKVSSIMKKTLAEIFSLKKMSFGRRAFTVTKSLELCSLLFIELMKKKQDGEEIGMKKEEFELMETMKEDLRNKLAKPPKIDDLVREYGMSATKLRETFKRVVGTSIHQFILSERFHLAYDALVNSEAPVSKLAIDLGFNTTAHFSDAIKKKYGVSPSELRKSIKYGAN